MSDLLKFTTFSNDNSSLKIALSQVDGEQLNVDEELKNLNSEYQIEQIENGKLKNLLNIQLSELRTLQGIVKETIQVVFNGYKQYTTLLAMDEVKTVNKDSKEENVIDLLNQVLEIVNLSNLPHDKLTILDEQLFDVSEETLLTEDANTDISDQPHRTQILAMESPKISKPTSLPLRNTTETPKTIGVRRKATNLNCKLLNAIAATPSKLPNATSWTDTSTDYGLLVMSTPLASSTFRSTTLPSDISCVNQNTIKSEELPNNDRRPRRAAAPKHFPMLTVLQLAKHLEENANRSKIKIKKKSRSTT